MSCGTKRKCKSCKRKNKKNLLTGKIVNTLRKLRRKQHHPKRRILRTY